MNQIYLNSARLRDQILGCWMGKNCGGTLGTPLEKAWGEAEPFDVWWYPALADGGIPNDDLEMPLVWLRPRRSRAADPKWEKIPRAMFEIRRGWV